MVPRRRNTIPLVAVCGGRKRQQLRLGRLRGFVIMAVWNGYDLLCRTRFFRGVFREFDVLCCHPWKNLDQTALLTNLVDNVIRCSNEWNVAQITKTAVNRKSNFKWQCFAYCEIIKGVFYYCSASSCLNRCVNINSCVSKH